MNIVADSKRVITIVYETLKDDSYCLVTKISMDDVAKDLNMSNKHLNLCIHYLIESGYLKGDFSYCHETGSSKELILTSIGINYCENAHL